MLTPKQEKFCVVYLETGNASEAYRQAYDAGSMKPETVNRKAKDLIDNGKITARLQELRSPVVARAQITLESHLAELEALRELAKADQRWAPAIQAEVSRGKAAGLYVEKVAVESKRSLEEFTNDELAALLARGRAGGTSEA